MANTPEALTSSISSDSGGAEGQTLFYYEAYEFELESDGLAFDPGGWRPISSVPSAGTLTDVAPPPADVQLLGYDVVVFGDYLEHSPLSCNNVAAAVSVNRHCLFDTLEMAKEAIDSGAFGGGCEEGIYRIYSVSIVPRASGGV